MGLLQAKKTGPPKKEKAPASATNTSKDLSASCSSSNSIADTKSKGNRKKTGDSSIRYTMESSLRRFSIKIYAEQLPNGEDDLRKRIAEQKCQDIQILGIKHNRDFNNDDYWVPSAEKPHIHIIGRFMDKKPRKVRTILKMLGIVFREKIDDNIFGKSGLEEIRTFEAMAMYLTHETEQAMADGKTLYDITEIFSNLDIDGIKQVRDGYSRIAKNSHKATMEEMAELCKTAQRLGEEFKDFEEWYMQLPLTFQSNSKMKQCKEHYNYGLKKAVEGKNNINRLSIFIQGGADTGKTYAVKQFFVDRNMPTIAIDVGGTGALDTLTTRTQGIIVDDATYSSLLRMSDNYAVQVKRRNSSNPWWCGSYFVIVSNDSFDDFIKNCGTNEDVKALKSRFYICEVFEDEYLKEHGEDYKELRVLSASKRGTIEEQKERLNRFLEFKKAVEKTMNDYNPTKNVVDYSILGL